MWVVVLVKGEIGVGGVRGLVLVKGGNWSGWGVGCGSCEGWKMECVGCGVWCL